MEWHRDFYATRRGQVAWGVLVRFQRRESELAQSIHDKARSVSVSSLQLQSQWSDNSKACVVLVLLWPLCERCEFSCECADTRSGDLGTGDSQRIVCHS